MSRSDRERLADILSALDRCLQFQDYLSSNDATMSAMALDAILRNLAVVGEAAKQLSEETRKELAPTPWHSIAGLRNVVIHEYFRIDNQVVQDILEHEVDSLAGLIRAYLWEDRQQRD